MSQFTLAVIIPNYNNGKYLKEGVESVLQQTLLPNEIIIVDDCSTDDSCEIINDISLQYGKIIKPLYLKQLECNDEFA